MLSPSYWVGQKVWSGFPKQKNPNKLFSQSNISLGALGLWNPWQKGADRSWLQGFLLVAQWRGAVTVAYLAIRLADLAEIGIARAIGHRAGGVLCGFSGLTEFLECMCSNYSISHPV